MKLNNTDDTTVCICAVCNKVKRAIRHTGGTTMGYKDFMEWYNQHATHEHHFIPIRDLDRRSGWTWAVKQDTPALHDHQ